MLRFIIGKAGTGKTAAIYEELRQAVERRESRRYLLVPEQYSHEAERELCRICGDALSLTAEVFSFTGLARRVGQEKGGLAASVAGKIVEVGNIEEIFYEPKHPYTWGLLSAMPDLETDDARLYTIPGSPPNLLHEVKGDAFAPRNRYALKIDSIAEPPMFQITRTHFAATWLLDPRAPKVEMPEELKKRVARMLKEADRNGGQL